MPTTPNMKVRTAVIPAAGLGTRFLPATRSIPKVMVPVLDRPPIQLAVEEAAAAGIERVVLVLSPGHDAVYRHFDDHRDLEEALAKRGNAAMAKEMRRISELVDVSHVYQMEPLGLGHAVLTARSVVGDNPFAVFLPDDVIWNDSSTIGAMADVFYQYGGPVIAVKEVPDSAVPSLGIVDPEPITESLFEIKGMVEKPPLESAPSNLAIIGRYVLTPEVFDALEGGEPGALGEIQLTDAIEAVRAAEQKVYGYRFPGVHFDVGTPLGMLKASVYAALESANASEEFRDWLSKALRKSG